jgi:predicted DsbA family dithiol-disulfide isomerase
VTPIEAKPGTLVVFRDLGCPWAHLCLERLWSARARLGLEGAVTCELRAFPLELFNERPTPKPTLDAEIALLSAHAPEAGQRPWSAPDHHWPVTMLPALEAVAAAALSSRSGAEQLDRALRLAFYRDHQTICLRHVILEAARTCPDVRLDAFVEAFDSGAGRRAVMADFELARSDAVRGSPHVFAPGGYDLHNPGIELHWEGKTPVIDRDDPDVYERLLLAAAGGQ